MTGICGAVCMEADLQTEPNPDTPETLMICANANKDWTAGHVMGHVLFLQKC
jgi:hypothetical protein